MYDSRIRDGLNEIFRDLFGDDTINLRPEMTADDVEGWDSIKHINLVVAVEDHFGIKIQTAEIDRLKNVGDLEEIIAAKIG